MGLERLKKTFTEIADDLATLEVATFTSSVAENGVTIPEPADPPADADATISSTSKQLFANIRTQLNNSLLVGYSRFELEGDSINFVNSDLGPDKKYLIDGHNSLVEGAQKSRKDFFDFVLKAIRQ